VIYKQITNVHLSFLQSPIAERDVTVFLQPVGESVSIFLVSWNENIQYLLLNIILVVFFHSFGFPERNCPLVC